MNSPSYDSFIAHLVLAASQEVICVNSPSEASCISRGDMCE